MFSSSPSIHLAPDAQQQQQHHHRALLHSSPDPREQAAIDRHNQLINLITASNESLDRQMKQVLLRVGALEDRMDQLFSDISNGIGTSFERTQI